MRCGQTRWTFGRNTKSSYATFSRPMVRRCWSFRARKKLAVVIERICSAGRACRKATRLRALEGKRAKLKNLLTEQMLDLAARKVLVSKKR